MLLSLIYIQVDSKVKNTEQRERQLVTTRGFSKSMIGNPCGLGYSSFWLLVTQGMKENCPEFYSKWYLTA